MNLHSRAIMALTLFGLLLTISGCTKQPIHRQLKTFPQKPDYKATQHNITVQAKILDTQESKQLFNDYVPYAKKLPRQPHSSQVKTIVTSISNNSNQTVTLHKKDIKLNLVNYKNIHFSTSTNKKLVMAGSTIAAGIIPFLGVSLAAFLSATPGCCPCWFFIPLTVGTGCAVLGSTAFCTGSMIWHNSAQKQLHRNFQAATLKDVIVIEPQQHKEFLCFVREQSLVKDFTLTVNDAQTGLPHTTFAVSLNN